MEKLDTYYRRYAQWDNGQLVQFNIKAPDHCQTGEEADSYFHLINFLAKLEVINLMDLMS